MMDNESPASRPAATMSVARYWRMFAFGIARFVVFMVAVFLLAGRISYWQGWAWGGVGLLATLIVALLFRGKRELMQERLKPGPGTKWWDRVFYALYIPGFLAVIGGAAMDAGRVHWSPPLPPAVYVASYVLLVYSYFLAFWAMWTNRFFSSVVRIQSDRGQTVVREGPYRYVRHPGYAGAIPLVISTALSLGSLWALAPAAFITVLFVVRTALEDATLQRELPGYAEYAREVRYRLIPGIW